jgi:hypothetical protein
MRVPRVFSRIGNYKEGEISIVDVVCGLYSFYDSTCSQFIIPIIFKAKLPGGKEVEYISYTNATYSSEALHGMVIVPVVNREFFLMFVGYAPFIGEHHLDFPSGFIPVSERDLSAREVALSIINREIGPVVAEIDGHISEPQLLRGDDQQTLRLFENATISFNQTSVTMIDIRLDVGKFEARSKRFREFKLIRIEDFLSNIRGGKIHNEHTLAAYTAYLAVS